MSPALRTLLYTAAVPGLVLVAVPLALLAHEDPAARGDGWWRWLGLGPIAAGVALYARCARDFATAGRGTPNPADPPRRLVARGPYRRVRNPMYLAVLAVAWGEALLAASPLLARYALGMLVVLHLLVVAWEEPRLARAFGEAYERYRGRVPRWLPRLRAPREPEPRDPPPR